MNLETLVADAGYAVINEVMDESAVARLVEEISALTSDGHGVRHLQDKCESVRDLCEDERVLELSRAVIGPGAFVVRTLFFDKNDKANWKVPWHQDLTIALKERIDTPGFGPWSLKDGVVHVQPPIGVLEGMVTVRIHLDDCTVENGPLRVLPGSHRSKRLSAEQIEEWKKKGTERACVVRRGGVVVMKPLILHASSQALEPTHRRVVHLEFAAQRLPDGLKWASR